MAMGVPDFDISQYAKEPFAVEAATTSLLVKGITSYPVTNTELDTYLADMAKGKAQAPIKERLSRKHYDSFKRGEELYTGVAACIGCHGDHGRGMPNLGPPLDESEWVTGDSQRLAKILLHGLQGPIQVNGVEYKPLAAMPGLFANSSIQDKDLADIMTYLRSNWSNRASLVTEDQVKVVREETRERNGKAYTASELND